MPSNSILKLDQDKHLAVLSQHNHAVSVLKASERRNVPDVAELCCLDQVQAQGYTMVPLHPCSKYDGHKITGNS